MAGPDPVQVWPGLRTDLIGEGEERGVALDLGGEFSEAPTLTPRTIENLLQESERPQGRVFFEDTLAFARA